MTESAKARLMREVDHCLSLLPADLDDLVAPLRGSIGRPEHGEYYRPDEPTVPPVLRYHRWLLDDIPELPAAEQLSTRLFAAGYLRLCADEAQRLLLDGEPSTHVDYMVASAALQHLADVELASVLPADSPCGTEGTRQLLRGARAGLLLSRERRSPATPIPERLHQLAARRWASMTPLSLAVVHHAGRVDSSAGIVRLLDRCNEVAQLRADVLNLRLDAARGVLTYPIAMARARLGGAAMDPDLLLGTFAASGCGAEILAEGVCRATDAARYARELALPSFAGWLEETADALSDLQVTLRVISTVPGSPTRAPHSGSLRSAINQAMEMARGHLTADPELREAWDVYRNGFLGPSPRTGRPFPTGFVVENLCASGIAGADRAAEVLSCYADNHGDYFDGPVRLPQEIDTIGMMLRVRRWSGEHPSADAILRRSLELIRAESTAHGGIPVWIRSSAPPGARQALVGVCCAACLANFLLGLLAHGYDDEGDLLRTGVGQLVHELDQRGIAASTFYPVGYLTWLVTTLTRQLAGREPVLAAALEPVRDTLLARQAECGASTSQAAALVLLSRAETGAGASASWAQLLLRSQRPDGGWGEEPLYWIPTPTHPYAWYGSRTTTTSLCYRALTAYTQGHSHVF